MMLLFWLKLCRFIQILHVITKHKRLLNIKEDTQRYIRKLSEKPISCGKLRDQYKQLTAQVGCNCNFSKTKECYPPPETRNM